MTPALSIVIPSYNRYLYLAQSLHLLEKQSCRNFEVIVIDDGSTDETSTLFSLYWDIKIRYIKVKNRERGAARNLGIILAQSDYVTFLDSDDLLHPLHVEHFLRFVKANNSPPLIVSGQSFSSLDFGSIDLPIYDVRHDHNTLLRGNPYSCNFSINKTLLPLLFVEGREYSTCEDWIFLFIAERAYSRPLFLPFISVQMREHSGRSMHQSHKVISARRASLDYLMTRCDLSCNDQRSLIAWSSYFMAIHTYLVKDFRKCYSHLIVFVAYKPGILPLFLALKLFIKAGLGSIHTLMSIL